MLTYKKKGRGTHKFIAFWEIKKESVNSVCEKAEELMITIREDPEKYPWSLFGPYCFEGETKGFQVFETDNQEKMEELSRFWGSYVNLNYHSIKETRIWEINDSSVHESKHAFSNLLPE
jgi:hypothetical protein